jgi:RNAse (barnase) inhibitor barstar
VTMHAWFDLAERMPGLAGSLVHVRDAGTLETDAEVLAAAGFERHEIAGTRTRDAASFLAEAGRALRLPEYYGATWDALLDCLADVGGGENGRVALVWRDAGTLMATDPQAYVDAVLTLDRAAAAAASSDNPVQAEVFLYP